MKDAFMFNQTHVRQYMYILFGWTAERERDKLFSRFCFRFALLKKIEYPKTFASNGIAMVV